MILTETWKRAKTSGHINAMLRQHEPRHETNLVDDLSSSAPLESKMISRGYFP